MREAVRLPRPTSHVPNLLLKKKGWGEAPDGLKTTGDLSDPLISRPNSISVSSDQAREKTVGLFCKITSATKIQLGGTQEGEKSHKSLRGHLIIKE